jgi:hypothetical protein
MDEVKGANWETTATAIAALFNDPRWGDRISRADRLAGTGTVCRATQRVKVSFAKVGILTVIEAHHNPGAMVASQPRFRYISGIAGKNRVESIGITAWNRKKLGREVLGNPQGVLDDRQHRRVRSDVYTVCTGKGIGKGQTSDGRKVLIAGTADELEPATFLKGS